MWTLAYVLFSVQSDMVSAGCQANIADTEGILGIVMSLKEQLSEIQRVNQSLIGKSHNAHPQ